MVNLKKAQNGLYLNGNHKEYTFEMLENGFEIIDDFSIFIELDKNMYCFICDKTIVDGNGPFNTPQELITALFT